VAVDFSRRTALYRFFDSEERLLYVGVAFDPEARWKEHAKSKPWWHDVTRKVIEWRPTRTDALIAEAEVIRAGRPLYNVKDSNVSRSAGPRPHAAVRVKPRGWKDRVVRVSNEDWSAYEEACAEKGISRSDDLRMHIKREVAALRRRQQQARDVNAAKNIAES
jgi:predicted GIY-YIG superfamily endonuclease